MCTPRTPADSVRNPLAVAPTFTGSNISSIWSPDGRRVAFVSRRGLIGVDRLSMTLAIRDVQSGEQREFVPMMDGFSFGDGRPTADTS